jgi:hypothetical protein
MGKMLTVSPFAKLIKPFQIAKKGRKKIWVEEGNILFYTYN